MQLASLLIVVVHVATLATVKAELDLSSTLATICQGEGNAANEIIFTSTSQVLELIKLYKQQGPSQICQTNKYDEAFESLEALLDPVILEDICSDEAYQRIRAFHLNFIHYYKPEFNRQELLDLEMKGKGDKTSLVERRPIPEALRRFFILFVKQINASCKHQIQPRLEELLDGQTLISDEEFALIERYKKESRRLMPLAKLGLSAITQSHKRSLRDLEMLNFALYDKENKQTGDNNDANTNNNNDEGTKLYLQVKFNDRLKQIQDACQMKFKPVYDEVFAPVIKLNNLGYVDHLKSKHEDEQLESDEKMTRWFNIIEACEIMKDVEVLHDSTEMAALASIIQQTAPRRAGEDRSDLNQVKLLSKEEADEFKAKIANGGRKLIAYDPELAHVEHKRVKFTPRMWLTERRDVQDELFYHDKDLKKILANKKSYMRVLVNDVRFYLKNFFYKHKKEISDRDKTSTLGRFSSFIDRHQMPIRLVMLLVTIIFISAHFG